ncbi:hypothetical protein C8R44DRAFT_819563 [Mycena epipterygia]|nr:hypothetical protein C8R44DRAFT_819563 [Mycena epipterygia]
MITLAKTYLSSLALLLIGPSSEPWSYKSASYSIACPVLDLYFLAFPNDHRFSKILVASIFLVEILQTLGDSRNTIRSFGSGWGNSEVLDEVGWAWFSVPILGSTIASAGQMFFAWRIYIISNKSVLIPTVIAIVTAVQLGAGIWSGVEICRAKKFSLLDFDRLRAPVVWLAGTALADLIIVYGMLFYLIKARQPGFRSSTYAVLSRIIKVTVETGVLCAIFALVDLSLFVAFNGNNYHLAVCIWFSKVYSNSIILILNSRAHIGHELPADDRMSGMTEVVFQSRGNPASALQVNVNVETSSTEGSIAHSDSDKPRLEKAV